ncbi:ribonuclease H-like domain-containing protein [Tanacetum coccineum]
MHSFFANQSNPTEVSYEDLTQVDKHDLEEIDLKWQMIMLSMRVNKFYKKTGRRLKFNEKEPVGFDKRYNAYKAKEGGKKQAKPKALVLWMVKALIGDDADDCAFNAQVEENVDDFALMAFTSDNEVKICTEECEQTYANLKKLFDAQKDQITDYSIEVKAYDQALKSVEAQLVCHQKNQLIYEEKIGYMKVDLDDKTNVLEYHKKLLAEAIKEKEDLKSKLENFQNSSKGLAKLLNSQLSAKDKSGLRFDGQTESDLFNFDMNDSSVFDNRSSDLDDIPLYDRFKKAKGNHAVPPPLTGIYMPPRSIFGLDESNFSYGPKQSNTSESEPKTNSDDDYEIRPSKEQVTPSYAFVNIAKHVKTPREPVNVNSTYSQSPGVDKRDWNGRMSKTLVSAVGENRETTVKASAGCNWRSKRHYWNKFSKYNGGSMENPPSDLEDEGIVDSGCSRHMTGNKEHLDEYQDIKGGLVTFGGSKGRITGKGKIRTGKLDFENVYFVKELGHFNLFSVLQICDKRNRVLFTESECLVLSPDFKMPDESQVLLKIPRKQNMYSFNLGNLAPKRDLACLVAKATINESNKWHRRLGHVNLKNLNKLVKGNLVRGLPSKFFQNDHTCVACQKGKQHKASCTQDNDDATHSDNEADQEYLVLPFCTSISSDLKSSELKNGGDKPKENTGSKTNKEPVDDADKDFMDELAKLQLQEQEARDAADLLERTFTRSTEELLVQEAAANTSSTTRVNPGSTPVNSASTSDPFTAAGPSLSYPNISNFYQDDSQIPDLEDIYGVPNTGIFTSASYDDEGAVADFTNLDSTVNVSPIPTKRIHSIHPQNQIIGDPKSAVQTRSKVKKSSGAHAFISYIQNQQRNNHKDFHHCLFACFLSQIEPKKISQALEEESWVDAMQEELLQFELQKVWILVDLPFGKKAIGTNGYTGTR